MRNKKLSVANLLCLSLLLIFQLTSSQDLTKQTSGIDAAAADKLHTNSFVEDSILDDVTDIDDLSREIKENILNKKSNEANHKSNITPASLVLENGAKPTETASATQDELPVETSSETAKFIMSTTTDTTETKEAPVLQTTSTDELIKQQAKSFFDEENNSTKQTVESTTIDDKTKVDESLKPTLEPTPNKENEAKESNDKVVVNEKSPELEKITSINDKKPEEKTEPAADIQANLVMNDETIKNETTNSDLKINDEKVVEKPVEEEKKTLVESSNKNVDETKLKDEKQVDEQIKVDQQQAIETIKAEQKPVEPVTETKLVEPAAELKPLAEEIPKVEDTIKPVEETTTKIEDKKNIVEAVHSDASNSLAPEANSTAEANNQENQVESPKADDDVSIISPPADPIIKPLVVDEIKREEPLKEEKPDLSTSAQKQNEGIKETLDYMLLNQVNETNTNNNLVDATEKKMSQSELKEDALKEDDSRLLELDTNDYSPKDVIRPKVIRNKLNSMKYCADLTSVKDLFSEHIEPLYNPVISVLPESVQVILLDETPLAGLTTASCLFIFSSMFMFVLTWYLVSSGRESKQLFKVSELNDRVLALSNALKKATYEKEVHEKNFLENEAKYIRIEKQLSVKEDQLKMLQLETDQKLSSSNLSSKEVEKLKNNESKLQKELTNAKLETNQIIQQLEQERYEFRTRISNLENEYGQKINELLVKLQQTESELTEHQNSASNQQTEIERLVSNQAVLEKKLAEKERALEMLQDTLLREKQHVTMNGHNGNGGLHSDDGEEDSSENGSLNGSYSNGQQKNDRSSAIDEIMRTAELRMKIKELEQEISDEKLKLELKANECLALQNRSSEHDSEVEKLKKRQHELEKSLKEQEMQVKLLNELREKDTKQHLKSYSDLDAQYKKKVSEAEKASHLLDQLRVKQERIQELESQFSRIEKQSTLERQTFEKQAHENWLSARKFEKELKETRQEIVVLKEKIAEVEQTNNLIRPIATNSLKQGAFFVSPSHQQIMQQMNVNKKSTDTSPQANSTTDETNNTSMNVNPSNAADTTNSNLNSSLTNSATTGQNGSDQPLQVDTNPQSSGSSLNEGQQQLRPPSTSSNPGQPSTYSAGQMPQAAMMHGAYMNQYLRGAYKNMPYAANPFAIDQRSSPDLMNAAAAAAAANTQYMNQSGRMPMAYPSQMMFRYYQQQQQQFMQQQQQQYQQGAAQGQMNTSTSQHASPRPQSAGFIDPAHVMNPYNNLTPNEPSRNIDAPMNNNSLNSNGDLSNSQSDMDHHNQQHHQDMNV